MFCKMYLLTRALKSNREASFNVGQQFRLPTGSLMDMFEEHEYTEAL